MCRMGDPEHHCSCCLKGRTCDCQMSSDTPDQPPLRATKPGLMGARMERHVEGESRASDSSRLIASSSPYLPIPKPPPKA